MPELEWGNAFAFVGVEAVTRASLPHILRSAALMVSATREVLDLQQIFRDGPLVGRDLARLLGVAPLALPYLREIQTVAPFDADLARFRLIFVDGRNETDLPEWREGESRSCFTTVEAINARCVSRVNLMRQVTPGFLELSTVIRQTSDALQGFSSVMEEMIGVWFRLGDREIFVPVRAGESIAEALASTLSAKPKPLVVSHNIRQRRVW